MNITIKQLRDMIHEAIDEVKANGTSKNLNEAIEVQSFRYKPLVEGPSCIKCDDTGKKFCACNGRTRGCSACNNTGEIDCNH